MLNEVKYTGKLFKNISKLFTVILALCLIVSGSGSTIFAEENSKRQSLDAAIDVMEEYILSGNENWRGFEIVSEHSLKNGHKEEIGYVFELKNGDKNGYGIVIEDNVGYLVVEASSRTSSPYEKNKEFGSTYIYTGPLNYFIDNDLTDTTVYDIQNKKSTNILILNNNSMNYVRSPKAKATITTKYLSSYNWNFETTQQPNGIACIPTSMAMALKYLHNSGQINITSSSLRNIEILAQTLYNNMYSSQYPNMIEASHVAPGLADTITSSTCANKVTTDYGVFGNSMRYGDLKAEIDGNYPAVVMFEGGVLASVEHATTLVGYKTTTFFDYVIVVDPLDETEKEIAWGDASSFYGYYILYVYQGW